jgi:hypothetical protein
VRSARAHASGIHQIQQGLMRRLQNPTNVLVAIYRRDDYADVEICGQGLLAAASKFTRRHRPTSLA